MKKSSTDSEQAQGKSQTATLAKKDNIVSITQKDSQKQIYKTLGAGAKKVQGSKAAKQDQKQAQGVEIDDWAWSFVYFFEIEIKFNFE